LNVIGELMRFPNLVFQPAPRNMLTLGLKEPASARSVPSKCSMEMILIDVYEGCCSSWNLVWCSSSEAHNSCRIHSQIQLFTSSVTFSNQIHRPKSKADRFYRVCAIWLFANIWLVNVLRSKMPALQFPVIIYSIFTNVAFTYGPLFPTIAAGEALIKQLLKGFLTAFAIATGVSLFIIPVSSRTVVFKEQTGYIQLIRATMKAQTAYLQSLETSDMFAPEEPDEDDGERIDDGKKAKKNKRKDKNSHLAANAQSMALKASLTALTGLHGKLHGDMSFGKREMAWGKFDAKDLDEIFTLFRSILIPLIGMSTITDIFERIAERRGWVRVPNSKFDRAESWEACGLEAKEKEKATWNEIMKTLHEPFEVVRNSLCASIDACSKGTT